MSDMTFLVGDEPITFLVGDGDMVFRILNGAPPVAGGGGVTDHGALDGLGDDDHAQYLTEGRGDALYYPQADVDSALAGKSDAEHTHDDLHSHSNKDELDLITDGDHDARTDNPHGVTASQVGADPTGTAASAVAAHVAGVEHVQPGYLSRAKFAWLSGATINLGAARYHHAGSAEQVVYWTSDIMVAATGMSANTWYYVYLDDSAIQANGGSPVITASQILLSITAPTFDGVKQAWYSGDDRCIMAVLTDSSGNVLEFDCSGDLFLFANEIDTNIIGTDIDTTWIDCENTAPSFGDVKVRNYFVNSITDNDSANLMCRKKGSTSDGITVCLVSYAFVKRSLNIADVVCDVSGCIQVRHHYSNNATVIVRNQGWYLPRGM